MRKLMMLARFFLLAGLGSCQTGVNRNGTEWEVIQSERNTLRTSLHILRDVGMAPSRGESLLLRSRVASKKAEWILLSWRPLKSKNEFGVLELRAYSSRGELASSVSAEVKADLLEAFVSGTGTIEFSGGRESKLQMTATGPLEIRDILGEKSLAMQARLDPKGESIFGVQSILFSLDLRIMSLNALNLWDDNPNNTAEEQLFGYDAFRPEFSNWYERSVQKAKAKSIARILMIAGVPDVVALQEVESAGNRSEVFRKGTPLRLALEDLGYRTFLLGEQDPKRPVAITTAIISRVPIVAKEPIAFDLSSPVFASLSEEERRKVGHSGRNAQQVELAVGGIPVRIINNHWRSRGCSDDASCEVSEKVRLAMAKLVVAEGERFRTASPNGDMIVLGDMNADVEDESVLALESSMNRSQFETTSGTKQLYNLWNEIPKSDRWERTFAGKGIVLSQLLLGDNLFDRRGLALSSGSFEVVGHGVGARDVLLNADGDALRWQEQRLRLEDAPADLKHLIQKTLAARGCFGENAGRRRCKVYYTEHQGRGYSDHLGIAADFHLWGGGIVGRVPKLERTLVNSSSSVNGEKDCDVSLAGSEVYPDVRLIDWNDENNLGRCVRLDFAKSPAPLLTRGIYDSGYILVNGKPLGIGMIGSYDPRPTSNMCFARKVLQKSGGKVARAVGRIGYDNGMLSVLMASRDHIVLTDLPAEKTDACR